MKVVIMTDLEGPSGINGRDKGLGNQTVNSATACDMLVEEVNACVRGLVKAGVDEIIVWDGHGGSNSIDIAKLHPAAKLGTIGADLAPCVFVDASCDAYIELGHHAMEGVVDGYMNHTFNSHAVCNMWLNDTPIGEIGIGAYEAAYFGVPTILVSGDAAACREAKALLPDVTTVVTKDAISRYTVVNHNPVQVRAELEAASEAALNKLKQKKYKLLKLPKHFKLKLELMCPNQTIIFVKNGAELLNHNTVCWEGDDFVDVWSRYCGVWGAGVHNKLFGITPQWRA